MSAAPPWPRRLVVGTRGSELALSQTEEALRPLRESHPDVNIELSVIRTTGDRERTAPLSLIGGKGVFAREIELALLEGHIDVAVHSLKDLPPRLEPGLALLAVPPRTDPRDALVSRDSLPLTMLPPGSRVGTGSARRRVLLLEARPDIQVVETRGNVGTRIRRVRSGDLDAVVLAAAGLTRLGRLSEAVEVFPEQMMVPAPGQGALAIEGRSGGWVAELVSGLDDPSSHVCAQAERAFLGRLGAGCTLPVAAYATIDGDTINLKAVLASIHTGFVHRASARGPREQAEALGNGLAAELLAMDNRDAFHE